MTTDNLRRLASGLGYKNALPQLVKASPGIFFQPELRGKCSAFLASP